MLICWWYFVFRLILLLGYCTMSADINAEIEGARSFCLSVALKCPPNDQGVTWLKPNEQHEIRSMSANETEIAPHEEQEIGKLFTQRFYLLVFMNKLTDIGQKYFNIPHSPPTFAIMVIAKIPNEQRCARGPQYNVVKLKRYSFQSERLSLRQLVMEVSTLDYNCSLIVEGFPLEGLSAQVLYLIGNLFRQVGFYFSNSQIVFHEYGQCSFAGGDILQNILLALGEESDLKFLIPTANFYESKFYEYLTYLSCIHAKKQVEEVLSIIDSSNKNIELSCSEKKNELPLDLFDERAQQNSPNTNYEEEEKHIPVDLPVLPSQIKELPVHLFDERAQQNTPNTNYEEEEKHIPVDLPVLPPQIKELPVHLFDERAQQKTPNTNYEEEEKHIPVDLFVLPSQKKELPVHLFDERAQQNTPNTNFEVAEKHIPVDLPVVPSQSSSTSNSESLEKRTFSRRKKLVKSELFHELKRLFIKINEVDVTWPTKEENVLWVNIPVQSRPTFEMVKRQWKYTSFKEVEVTKFCSVNLLNYQRRLCQILREDCGMTSEDIQEGSCLSCSVDESYRPCLKSYRWHKSPLEVKVLDFSRELWLNIEEHATYQTKTLQRILRALEDMWRNDCLELCGFPLLSEYNVSLIFILGHLFEKVGLFYPKPKRNVIFFYNFLHNPQDVKHHLEKALIEPNIQSLVPLKNIFSRGFYESVRDANNLFLKKQCREMLKIFLYDD